MIEIICSGCGATLEAQDHWAGKRVKCPDCGARMLVPPAAEEAATVPPAPRDETVTKPPRWTAEQSEQTTVPPSTASSEARPSGGVLGYEILGELGRGGMGVVYKARHTKLGRLVALKMILVAEHAGPEERARFQTEAEAVARLQHPNIVQIHEVGEQDGRPFFSLEFCAGGSLEKKLGGVPLPPQEAARLARTLALAIHAAHEAGVVHRDLKPANVLLTKNGTPKITDFGLAKKLGEAGQTATGAVMGTPSYMAPEQAGGKSKEIGLHTDVYALGALLYELLTGRPPFRAATSLDTILQVVSDEPVPPRILQKKTPRDLETICLKCLQKEPRQRYASARALAEDLGRFLAGDPPIHASPLDELETAVRWARKSWITAILTVLMTMLIVLAYLVAAAFSVAYKTTDVFPGVAWVPGFLATMALLVRPRRWVVYVSGLFLVVAFGLPGVAWAILEGPTRVALQPAAPPDSGARSVVLSAVAGVVAAGVLGGSSWGIARWRRCDMLSVFFGGVIGAVMTMVCCSCGTFLLTAVSMRQAPLAGGNAFLPFLILATGVGPVLGFCSGALLAGSISPRRPRST
jgi:tRNA A-37 threonylcarbamoyl transferase component Bud32/DNA-directed RNA polymerase subunit RPC12/RpoP